MTREACSVNCKNCENCFTAAMNGHVKCLEYLHKNGCSLDKKDYYNAAYGDHLECLEYLHKNECPLDINTCDDAAKYDNLECLKYAHENGYPKTCCNSIEFCTKRCLWCWRLYNECKCDFNDIKKELDTHLIPDICNLIISYYKLQMIQIKK